MVEEVEKESVVEELKKCFMVKEEGGLVVEKVEKCSVVEEVSGDPVVEVLMKDIGELGSDSIVEEVSKFSVVVELKRDSVVKELMNFSVVVVVVGIAVSEVVDAMVGSRVEVLAITSVLNSQKNSGADEDVDVDMFSEKISEIVSLILSLTSSVLAEVAVVSENISEMRDFAVLTSVVSAKISEMRSLSSDRVVDSVVVENVDKTSVVETSGSTSTRVVVLGSKVVVERSVVIPPDNVVDNRERILRSVVGNLPIVELSVVSGTVGTLRASFQVVVVSLLVVGDVSS